MSLLALLLCSVLGTTQAASAVSYTTRTVDGRQFLVASDAQAEVWLLPIRFPEEIGAFLLFTNQGEEVMKVFPQRVRAEAIRSTPRGEKRVGLRTYHPAQYESLLRKRGWTTGGLVPSTPMPIGSARNFGHPPSGRRRDRLGFGFEGAHTAGVIIPQRLQLETFTRLLRQSPTISNDLRGLLGSLLWPHEIPAHQSYSGLVYMKLQPGDLYRIRVPAGQSSFQFEVSLR